eukprot:CFRG4020T1
MTIPVLELNEAEKNTISRLLIRARPSDVAVQSNRCKNEHTQGLQSQFKWLGVYLRTVSKRQEGPMCGLTALSMAATYYGLERRATMNISTPPLAAETIFSSCFLHSNSGKDEPVPVHRRLTLDTDSHLLLLSAVKTRVTMHGEVFSSNTLGALASNHYGLNQRCVKECTDDNVIEHLLTGNIVLVPYDSDFNHEPCRKNGVKAHWALLTGVLFLGVPRTKSSEEEINSVNATEMNSLKAQLANVYVTTHANSHINARNYMKVARENIYSKPMVLVRHGKSSHLALWSLDSLLKSNRQLTLMDPSIHPDVAKLYAPMSENLCGTALFLNGSSIK